VFGNVFGNTIYSASLVVAVFTLGMAIGFPLVIAGSKTCQRRDHSTMSFVSAIAPPDLVCGGNVSGNGHP